MILLAGLQGSGKTTTRRSSRCSCARTGKTPALVAADLQRPAAIDQLEQLGRQIQIPVYRKDTKDPVEVVEGRAPGGADRRVRTSSSSTPPAASTSTRS